MIYSKCCSSELEKVYIVDEYHGSDDEYELKVPVFRCSKCEKLFLPSFMRDSHTIQTSDYLKIS